METCPACLSLVPLPLVLFSSRAHLDDAPGLAGFQKSPASNPQTLPKTLMLEGAPFVGF